VTSGADDVDQVHSEQPVRQVTTSIVTSAATDVAGTEERADASVPVQSEQPAVQVITSSRVTVSATTALTVTTYGVNVSWSNDTSLNSSTDTDVVSAAMFKNAGP